MRCATAGYGAVLMAVDRANAFVTDNHDCFAADNKMPDAAVEHFATVRCSIAYTNYVGHLGHRAGIELELVGRIRIEFVSLSQSKTVSSSLRLGSVMPTLLSCTPVCSSSSSMGKLGFLGSP